MESILNIECSMFGSAKTTAPVTVNLLNWLNSKKYLANQKRVQTENDPDLKRKAKEAMPCITPSGIFSKRGERYLIKHSSLLAIDIDLKGNEHLVNYRTLKNELCKITNIAFVGHSVSGKGYWALVPIAHPEKHKQHFDFIKLYFESKGIFIDKACSDVSRLRFYSYDAEAYFNHSAKPLQNYYTPPAIKVRQSALKKFDGQDKPIWTYYNESTFFIEVLQNSGWQIESEAGSKIYFTRPGKTSGISAEYDSNRNVFYVFTDNGEPFEPNTGYNPFQVYTLLEHRGDFSRAAKTLLAKNDFLNVECPMPIVTEPTPTPEPLPEQLPEINLSTVLTDLKTAAIKYFIAHIQNTQTINS